MFCQCHIIWLVDSRMEKNANRKLMSNTHWVYKKWLFMNTACHSAIPLFLLPLDKLANYMNRPLGDRLNSTIARIPGIHHSFAICRHSSHPISRSQHPNWQMFVRLIPYDRWHRGSPCTFLCHNLHKYRISILCHGSLEKKEGREREKGC